MLMVQDGGAAAPVADDELGSVLMPDPDCGEFWLGGLDA
jgi:hypothetical protein